MEIIGTIVIGCWSGSSPNCLCRKRTPTVIITILLGIAGWFLAAYLGQAMNLFDPVSPPGS